MKKLRELSKAVILNNHQLLLVRESNENFWSLPGGKKRESESLLECLARELDEELNKTKIISASQYHTLTVQDTKNPEKQKLITYWMTKIGTLKGVSAEIAEYRWMCYDEISKNGLSTTIKAILPHLKKENYF